MRNQPARKSDDVETNFSPIQSALFEIYREYRENFSGKVASYIPELAKVNPAPFGIALATADGEIYEVGDSRQFFTIQSISKPFVYALALEDHGMEQVLQKIGVEPSGEAFNSIVFEERGNRPFNPMVNAGAIAATALIKGPAINSVWNACWENFPICAAGRCRSTMRYTAPSAPPVIAIAPSAFSSSMPE